MEKGDLPKRKVRQLIRQRRCST